MKMQVRENAVKTNPKFRRVMVVTGLLVASFMSTSYARSNNQGQQCAGSYAELEEHPEGGGKCSPSALRRQVSRLKGKVWNGPMGNKVEFVDPGSGAFFIKLNGQKKFGNICCAGGVWSLPGYGAITPQGSNNLSIGNYSFSSQQDSFNRYSPVQFAELPNSSTGVN